LWDSAVCVCALFNLCALVMFSSGNLPLTFPQVTHTNDLN